MQKRVWDGELCLVDAELQLLAKHPCGGVRSIEIPVTAFF